MASSPRPNQIPPDRLAANRDEGEYFTIADDPDDVEIIESEPGAFADDAADRAEAEPRNDGFYANLAEVLPDTAKDAIASELIRLIDVDIEARKPRDEQYEEGIKRSGLGKDAPGGAAFEGASRVVHPMITQACIDFQSRIMKEMFPPSGPVKPEILGVATKEKLDKARRVADHINFQIMRQISGARPTMEVLFSQVPLGGSQYIRQFWDHRLKRPSWQFASVDKVILPFAAADFASASRKTFIDRIDKTEFKNRVSQGMYLDLDLPKPSFVEEGTKSEVASRKVEGLDEPVENVDDARDLYETTCYLDVTEEMAAAFEGGDERAGEIAPYLVTIDKTSREMLAMYRAWEDGDSAREPIDHLFEFSFIPWKGPYAIGLPQIIGGLSAATTGALRALLDSAHVNNTPSAVILKGSGVGGQSRMPNPGELVELDTGTEADDIRKRVMPMPFNPPAPVLYQLLGFLENAAAAVVRTSMDDSPQNAVPANTPVGTQLSRVEEGLVVFSAIHGRAHYGMDRLVRGLYRLNRLWLPDEIKVDAAGTEILVRREDYQGPCDVCPVSDPSIFSELQRYGQIQAIQQRQLVVPQLYKAPQVELAFLRLIKWPDPETLLNVPPEPVEENAVNENLRMVLGQPVAVWPDQDHLAHLQVHLDFMKSPALGGNPIMAPTFLAPCLKHAMEHIGYFYTTHTEQFVSVAARVPHRELAGEEPEVKETFDRLLATASQSVVPEIEQALQGALPVLLAAMQQAKAAMPPPPLDPARAAVAAAQAETQRKAAADQAGTALDTQKAQTDAAMSNTRNQIAMAQIAQKERSDELAAQTKLQTTASDNETAIEVAQSRPPDGAGGDYTDGKSMAGS